MRAEVESRFDAPAEALLVDVMVIVPGMAQSAPITFVVRRRRDRAICSGCEVEHVPEWCPELGAGG